MINFGTSNDNSGSLDWPSGLALPTSGDFSCAWFAYHDDASTGTWGTIFTMDGQNIICRYSTGSSYKNRLLYWNGAGYINETAAAAVTADTTVRSYAWTLDDAAEDVNYYVEGSVQAAPTRASSGNYSAGSGAYAEINDYNGNGHGASGQRGQVALWAAELSGAEVAQFHNGVSMPQIANLKFWSRCITPTTPGSKDEISGDAATTYNAPTNFVSHGVDGYFRDGGNYYFLLSSIFMPMLVNSAHLFGGNLMSEASKIITGSLNARCGLDWTKDELKRLLDQFRRRPACQFL